MSSTPAGELREAARLMRERAQAASEGMYPEVAVALADWLDDVAETDRTELPHWVEASALKVARAYLNAKVAR